jgi:hypothetical protein
MTDLVVLVLGGFAAGVLNVAAAGGSLLSFLTLGFIGVPPLVANATNLAATPASFVGGVPRAWRDRREHRDTWLGFVSAIAGTVVGVLLVNIITADLFRRIAPVLLLIAAMTLIVHPWLRPMIDKRGAKRSARPVVVAGWLFVTSIYAGGFGGGVGVLVLLVFACTTSWPWAVANGRKNIVCLVTSLVGLAAFSVTGLVNWPLAATLAVSMTAGGLFGQWLAGRLPEDLLRTMVAVTTAFGAGHMAAT